MILESQVGSSNKVHNILGGMLEKSNEANHSKEPVNTLQNQNEENQKALQKVIDGFAQVTKVISQPKSGAVSGITTNIQRRSCWFHNSDNHDIN